MSATGGAYRARRPVVIAGGGLAGGAAACRLARAGTPVLLLEREAAPIDKICGEFLSGEAQRYLERIGIDAAALGAQCITHLRLVRDDAIAESALPFCALGLSRRALDEAVLERAAACGAEVMRGQTLQRVDVEADVALQTTQAGELHAHTLFLATGKHDARGLRRIPPSPPEDLVGFKTYFALAPAQTRALQGAIEVLLFDRGYAGLQLVEGGRANLCLLVDRADLQRNGGRWDALLRDLQRQCAHLAMRLRDAQPLLDAPLSIFRVPYGFVHRPSAHAHPGVFRLGDQAAVIASFSGDGMSIALHSAFVASNAYLAGATASEYHARLRRDVARQIGRAGLMYRFGRWQPGQRALMSLARTWPGSLQLAAHLTRVAPRALARGLA